jgi:hypothetical protein
MCRFRALERTRPCADLCQLPARETIGRPQKLKTVTSAVTICKSEPCQSAPDRCTGEAGGVQDTQVVAVRLTPKSPTGLRQRTVPLRPAVAGVAEFLRLSIPEGPAQASQLRAKVSRMLGHRTVKLRGTARRELHTSLSPRAHLLPIKFDCKPLCQIRRNT